MLWPTELILGSPLPSLGKKIKHPTCSSLLEDTFLPYCQPQLTGQGEVVQDEPMAFLLLEAASASGQEGMGWAEGYEWTCCLQKDKTKVFSPNWPRETHFLFVWNTYTKNVHVNLKYCSSLQASRKVGDAKASTTVVSPSCRKFVCQDRLALLHKYKLHSSTLCKCVIL